MPDERAPEETKSRWTIRRADALDVERLSLVAATTFLDAYAGVIDGQAIVAHCQLEHSPERYRELLEDDYTAWLAEVPVGRAPVGYAVLGAADLPGYERSREVELKRLYALSRYHGSGVGAGLMKAVVEEARRRGATRILLGVHSRNARALAFYAKHGFNPVGTRQFQVGHELYDDVVLSKSLV